jgi:hypothetical protein
MLAKIWSICSADASGEMCTCTSTWTEGPCASPAPDSAADAVVLTASPTECAGVPARADRAGTALAVAAFGLVSLS